MDGIVWVAMGKLVASRWATVGEKGRWRRVLRGWIERTGRYEPLVVRPCGGGEGDANQAIGVPCANREIGGPGGCYEIIHGHGRWRVLRELGHERVACVVWDVSEVEAMLYAATMNKVRGREVARKRVEVLREIANRLHHELRMTNDEANSKVQNSKGKNEVERRGLKHSDIGHSGLDSSFSIRHSSFRPEVWQWMGERLGERAEVLRRVLAGEERDRPAPLKTAGFEMREAFTVFLLPGEKRRVVEALRGVDGNVGRALVRTLNAEG